MLKGKKEQYEVRQKTDATYEAKFMLQYTEILQTLEIVSGYGGVPVRDET